MTDRWRLIAGHTPDTWLLILLLVVGALVLIDAVQELRRPAIRLGTPARVGLFALRLLGVAALALLIAEVSLVEERVSPTGPHVVVLVDSSASMALADGDAPGKAKTTRMDRLRALWTASADARLHWQESGLTIDLQSFARRLGPLSQADAQTLALSADGQDSDLTGALVELARSRDNGEGPALAGVVVLSDGLVVRDAAGEAPLRSAALALGVPITTVATGAPSIRDAAIRRVQAGEFAFVENVSEIDAELLTHGLEGEELQVSLERDGELIAASTAVAPADGTPLRLRFQIAPDRVGHFVYAVAIAPVEGEATLANNRRSFVVRVLRDKVRVLHVAGRPDWDVRALRTLLGRDPNVELLSYYILRGADDSDREDPSAPLSLIAFPTDQLFSAELGSFDLIVLHNFDALSHQVGRYLGDIARYVEEGGSVVVIGGDLGLAAGDYKNGRLGAVLPVVVTSPAGLETANFRPEIADAGVRHPITAWLSDPRLAGWSKLPELDSFNRLRIREDARGRATLLRHPDGAPLLAVAEPGKGRSVVLATGASWRLGFAPDLPLIDGARPYDLLWLGIIRWLLRDAAAQRLTLEVAPPTSAPGETIDLRASALSASYAPDPEVTIEWAIRPLDGGRTIDDDGDPKREAQGTEDTEDTEDTEPERESVAAGVWITDDLGRASQRLDPLPIGAYEAIAHRRPPKDDPQAPVTRARRVLLVEAPHHELAEVDADAGTVRLADLAARTGGEAIEARAEGRLPSSLKLAAPTSAVAGNVKVESRREVPLWDGVGALVLIVLAFGSEWILRRRLGLL